MTQYTLANLTQGLGVTIKGDPNCLISGVCPIHQSKPGYITFLTNSLYRKYLTDTQAAAVIVAESDVESCSVNAVISKNPYYTYSQIAAHFASKNTIISGIHPSAVVDATAHIDPSASIGANCVIGRTVKIGAKVVVGPGCIIGDQVSIDNAARLDANVTLYYGVQIGKRASIASGVVIGSDGFGFANEKGKWHKVPQLGSVCIGDDVDIGANTTIDCGAVEDTVIEEGVKLDNLIQVGHNVRIGAHTIIAGCVGIAGSAVIGRHCMIGGAARIAGHITIADQVVVMGGTNVSKSIPASGMYSSGVLGVLPEREFKKSNARFHRLEHLYERVKVLESALKDITERK